MADGRRFLSSGSSEALGQQDETLIDNNVSPSNRNDKQLDNSPMESNKSRKDQSIIISDSPRYFPRASEGETKPGQQTKEPEVDKCNAVTIFS